MKVIYHPLFEVQFIDILKYIKADKPNASIDFALALEELILEIPNFPFKYRKSFYFNNDNIRDMTYKKYTIIYEINLKENYIQILKIFNRNKPIL